MPAAVARGDGKVELLQLNRHDFELLLHHHQADSLILDLQIEEEAPVKVLLQEVQRDPVADISQHADFREISMTEKLRIHITVELVGEPIGVRSESGSLEQLIREIEVECLPGDIVEVVTADVSGLHIGESLSVAALNVPDGITVLTDRGVALAIVAAPRVEPEEQPVAAGEGAGAEPEVVGPKTSKEGEEAK